MTPILTGKTALITGGTSGIGLAIAECFAEQGAQVTVFGTNPEKGANALASIEQKAPGSNARFLPVNVSDFQKVEEAIASLGKLDILVNCAGITRDGLLMKMTEEDWDTVLDVNAKSCFNTCKAVIRQMLKARSGKILNIASVIGLVGNPGQVNYAASKGAIIAMTKALALEVAPRNIQVNCIAPGFIRTAMTDALTEEQREAILKRIPLGRMGHPEEVAKAALFLVSSLADYITGQVITVDGGMVM
jgi:3-oxoacyl-[acyl-carrier protein] reductase